MSRAGQLSCRALYPIQEKQGGMGYINTKVFIVRAMVSSPVGTKDRRRMCSWRTFARQQGIYLGVLQCPGSSHFFILVLVLRVGSSHLFNTVLPFPRVYRSPCPSWLLSMQFLLSPVLFLAFRGDHSFLCHQMKSWLDLTVYIWEGMHALSALLSDYWMIATFIAYYTYFSLFGGREADKTHLVYFCSVFFPVL